MTFQFRSMLDIEGDIQYRFSIAGVTARHSSGSTGRIRQLWNVGWQQLREIVALASDGSFLQGTAPATFASVSATTAAVTGEVYSEIDWPVDAVGVYGVRVLGTSGRWRPLKRIPWAAYQDYQYGNLFDGFDPANGPIGYTSRTIPTGVGSTQTAGKVMITPVPTGGTYRLWYLQAWQSQTADADVFPGHAEFTEWNIYNTMIKMLSPDADSQKVYTMWRDERKECREMIEARAKRLDDGMALEPRDARGDGYDWEGWRGAL